MKNFIKTLENIELLDNLKANTEGVEKVKKFAMKNYNKGGDGITECMSDTEILDLIKHGGKKNVLEDIYLWKSRCDEFKEYW